MAKAKQNRKIKRKKIDFSLEALDAKEVLLVGDFNNWNPKIHPMKSVGNGIWNKTVMLPTGTYQYKFLIDGLWKEDPKNEQVCLNCFGTQNSLLKVIVP